jgi:ribosomal protein S12 methylthiotransferase accessory factor
LRLIAKGYTRGTHRAIPPQETLSRVAAAAKTLGITRLANVTGLDYLGIPVFMAVRPNARSLSVSQGKGLDPASAAASAVMEALELAHAEEPRPRPLSATYSGLRARARVADPAVLPRIRGVALPRDQRIEWVEGVDLCDGSAIFVPFDLVHCRFDRRKTSAFLRTSNGLSSGNVWLEAVVAGICETIERDATSLWLRRGVGERRERRIDLQSVHDPECRSLLDALRDRGISVSLWDVTTDIGVACIVCRIDEAPGNTRSELRAFSGAGCHLSREVALIRAVTEAAQARLTFIAGSRDDLYSRDYEGTEVPDFIERIREEWERKQAGQSFERIPSNACATFEDDLRRLIECLKMAGLDQVISVDLTDDRFAIPVVRIVVPGLEVHDEHGRHRPGRRALALARRNS